MWSPDKRGRFRVSWIPKKELQNCKINALSLCMHSVTVYYVIVIARGRGFMAVNQLSPRAQPEDKVCLRCHKSLATRAITIIYPT